MTASDDGSAASSRPASDDAVRRMLAAVEASDGAAERGPGTRGSGDQDVVRTALATLPHDDQRLLWDRHVLGRTMDVVARELGVHARAAARRLRAAEDRLARALTAAHARGAGQQVCMETRGALHDYVRHHLGAGRRQLLEDHLFGCAGCMRAFIDVRHAAWALRDTAPLLLGGLAVGTSWPVVIGASGAASSGTGLVAWWGAAGATLTAGGEWVVRGLRQVFGRPVGIAAGVGVAAVAVAAAALVGGTGTGSSPQEPPPVVAEPPAAPDAPSPVPSSSPSSAPTPSPAEPTPSDDPVEPSDGPTPVPTEEAGDPPAQTVWEPGPAPDPSTTPDDEPPPQEPTPRPEPTEPEPTGPETQPTEPTPGTGPESPPADPDTGATPPTEPEPGPEPEPTPPPTPAPTPEEVTVSVTVEGIGWFRVVPTDGAEIVSVTPTSKKTKAEYGWTGYWRVWTASWRPGGIDVTLRGEPGTDPGVELVRWDRG